MTPIDSIVVSENRQRREFDPEQMASLKASLLSKGLMHPIVLREGNILVAGERRLRAITEIHMLGQTVRFNGAVVPDGYAPTVSLVGLDHLLAEEAELEENVARADLTWQERASAIARLHALRTAQAAERSSKGDEPVHVHTVRDTALEVAGAGVGRAAEAVRKSIIVAKAIADSPDAPAAKAKSVDEAFKILQRREEVMKNEERAAVIGKSLASEKHTLLNLDCLSIPTNLDGTFDVILTDPPYGMGADEFGASAGAAVAHRYDDSKESWLSLMQAMLPRTFLLAKPQAHMYLFCDLDRYHDLRNLAEEAGWTVHRTPLIWHKLGGSGRVPLPNHGPRRQYEIILYAFKGQRQIRKIAPDILGYSADENIGHAAQKPVALYRELLERSAYAGDRVLDFCAGSGTIFPAADSCGVFATGVEVDAGAYGLSAKRLQELDNVGNLMEGL